MSNIPVKLNNVNSKIIKAQAFREDLAEAASLHGDESSEYDSMCDQVIDLLRANIDDVLDGWIKHLKSRRDTLRQTT